MGLASPLAEPVTLDRLRNLSTDDATLRLGPGYGPALGRLPAGRQVFRGLPFDLGPDGPAPRFVLVDRPLTVPLDCDRPVSHVVVAHLCDAWRDDDGRRPAGLASGHVVPIGERLAAYTVTTATGEAVETIVRRRFEVADGILGWGSVAFAAVPHLDNEVVDWRGPHAAQTPGRYAAAGQSGSLTIMPGTYGGNQVGMSDFVPSATDDALLWLHAIELPTGSVPTSLRLASLTGGRPGSDIVVAAVTLFHGSADPLVRSARFAIQVSGTETPSVDLGTVIRTTPVRSGRGPLVGSGHSRQSGAGDDQAENRIVELSVARDAVVTIGGREVRGEELLAGPRPLSSDGPTRVDVLPAADIPVEVEVVDAATGRSLPSRVRFVARHGRYLAPEGHRDEVNPGFFEDTGGDLILAGDAYAYVPGAFTIGLPVGPVEVEVVAGFERRPVQMTVDVEPGTRQLRVPLERTLDLRDRGWVTADSHVHFLAPSTALLQAAAEDVDVVNLLAAGWGDLFTNVTDLPWGSIAEPGGPRRVVVGTENRQNMLGHLALLGARRPVTPLASGGPPEGRMAGALTVLLADWADRCRAADGLVVAAHFPLPYAEIAADILLGRIDAVEAQAFAPGLDDPMILEWYRYLNLGERLPIVAGTDKMSAEVPIGAVRTYTRIGDATPDGEDVFARWAAAVRAGRTFVTSGPLLELAVEGCEPGDVLALPGAASLQAVARVRAAQPVVSDLELVVNGRVVAATSAGDGPATELRLEATVEIERGSWIAARSRSPHVIESAFTTSMAAHTSPVYVEIADRPIEPAASDVAVVEGVIDGARTWVARLAAVSSPDERARMLAFFDRSLDALRARLPPA
jgi:hypothetical protein